MEEQYIWEMVSFACYYLKNSKTWTTSSYDKIVFASIRFTTDIVGRIGFIRLQLVIWT